MDLLVYSPTAKVTATNTPQPITDEIRRSSPKNQHVKCGPCMTYSASVLVRPIKAPAQKPPSASFHGSFVSRKFIDAAATKA
jgi:hypothetical protein